MHYFNRETSTGSPPAEWKIRKDVLFVIALSLSLLFMGCLACSIKIAYHCCEYSRRSRLRRRGAVRRRNVGQQQQPPIILVENQPLDYSTDRINQPRLHGGMSGVEYRQYARSQQPEDLRFMGDSIV